MQTRAKKRTIEPEQSDSIESNASSGTKATAKSKAGVKRVKSTEKKASESSSTSEGQKTAASKKAMSDAPHTGPDGVRTSVWLMKSEPDTFSIDALINSKNSTSHWDGVRNHEAKNLMKNSMKLGDRVLFYHSNTKEPGVVGLAKIVREAYPDHTAFDPKSENYDEKSTKEDPRWFMVDVKFDRKLKRPITLKELQLYKDRELSGMKLLNRGRLSVQPVSDSEASFILELENEEFTKD